MAHGGGLLRAWARLVRLPLAPNAAFDSVACLILALAASGLGIAYVPLADWATLAATSLLLYAMGMALNDLADCRRDRELAPDRPIPSGQISVRAASVAVFVLGLGAILLRGGRLGSREAVEAAVFFALLYNLYAKRIVAFGAFSMGMVRFANGALGVMPLVLTGTAPVWTLLGPLALGLYSAGVTVLSTMEEGAVSQARSITMRVLASTACALVAVLPWLACGHPTLGVLVGGGLLTSIAFARRPKKGPVKRQVLEMLLGLYFVSMCLATAGDDGSLIVNLAALVTAFVLIWLSQMLIRALR